MKRVYFKIILRYLYRIQVITTTFFHEHIGNLPTGMSGIIRRNIFSPITKGKVKLL